LQSLATGHPWLEAKLAGLLRLLESDAVMAAKELRYSSRKLASRLAATHESAYSASETDSLSIPAYLRRKGEEGKGRRK
jgi:hypothetical protein